MMYSTINDMKDETFCINSPTKVNRMNKTGCWMRMVENNEKAAFSS